MKDMKQLYMPVLIFVGILLVAVFVAWISKSYGEVNVRYGLGYINHEANNDSATLNSSTFTKVLNVNMDRAFAAFCNKSKRSDNKVVFINYRSVAESVDETGYILFGEDCFTMPSESIYTGEVTAIATTGTPLLTYMEY